MKYGGNLYTFVRESNLIEGIARKPSAAEIAAHQWLLEIYRLDANLLGEFQLVVAPGKPLRIKRGMNVRVGHHVAPRGGKEILADLEAIISRANMGADNPWFTHIAFETLHPFMDGNGRTGRALWAWQMQKAGRDPFALPFLHRFYYQTLENSSGRKAAA